MHPRPQDVLRWLRCVDELYGGSQAAALDALADLKRDGRDVPTSRDWPEWSRKETCAAARELRRAQRLGGS